MACKTCGVRCEHCEPYKSRDHERCLNCGSAFTLERRSHAKYCDVRCKKQFYYRATAGKKENAARSGGQAQHAFISPSVDRAAQIANADRTSS